MKIKLTPKQEKAAIKYVECGDKSKAYRHAYNTENMKPESVWRKAVELFDNVKVAAMVEELQAEHRERHNVTVDTITEELDTAYELAIDNKNPSAAVSSTLGKAKLHGLLIEKRQIETIGRPHDVKRLTDKELEEEIVLAREARKSKEDNKKVH